MAARLGGFTVHSFGGIPITDTQREKSFDSKWKKPDVNEIWKRISALRFLFIDETSAVGAEDLGALEKNLRDATQIINSYKLRPRKKRNKNVAEADYRAFGGINVIACVDWWQLTPVQKTSIAANVFKRTSGTAKHIMSSFHPNANQKV